MTAPAAIRALARGKDLTLPLVVRSGSKAYGIDVPGSDDDFVGTFVAPLRDFVSLCGSDDTFTGFKPDFALHEIGKFCRLALKGNPTILEVLWNPDVVEQDEWGRELTAMRSSFLHRGSLAPYVGYAESQMKRMVAGKRLHAKGGGYNGKYGAHLLRLVHAGIGLARTGEVVVRADRELAATLLRVRSGEVSMGEVLALARPLLERLRRCEERNDLPEEPERERIDDFVIRARLARG
ncbi:MAG: nucleotidyltransferase domain-containing protein [Planctomycetes bacterium]|nr:nucleotidyltransferase domain-containing protein [Planctomycetota bacterium]